MGIEHTSFRSRSRSRSRGIQILTLLLCSLPEIIGDVRNLQEKKRRTRIHQLGPFYRCRQNLSSSYIKVMILRAAAADSEHPYMHRITHPDMLPWSRRNEVADRSRATMRTKLGCMYCLCEKMHATISVHGKEATINCFVIRDEKTQSNVSVTLCSKPHSHIVGLSSTMLCKLTKSLPIKQLLCSFA